MSWNHATTEFLAIHFSFIYKVSPAVRFYQNAMDKFYIIEIKLCYMLITQDIKTEEYYKK